MIYNRLLTDADRSYYEKLINKMKMTCPEMMSRKIERANVQQAFILESVGKEIELKSAGNGVLCVGSFEDTASEVLGHFGVAVTNIDPSINTDLHSFRETSNSKYGIIFSTSVIEHVVDDEQFIDDICQLLTPDGIAILTCDFNNDYIPGDKLPYSDVRFYTKFDLDIRLRSIVERNNCYIIDTPDWSGKPDFTHDGCNYSFATFVFRKDNK